MLPALLAAIGLPVLTKIVGAALGRIDNPFAKAAADALGMVGDAVAGRAISPEQVAEANRHIETLAEIDSTETRTALTEINRSMRAELASGDAYVRRWRPTFGYAVAFTWVLQVGALVYTIVWHPAEATKIVEAMASLGFIWGVALSVLGISVWKRSVDKARALGEPPPGLIETLAAARSKPKKES